MNRVNCKLQPTSSFVQAGQKQTTSALVLVQASGGIDFQNNRTEITLKIGSGDKQW